MATGAPSARSPAVPVRWRRNAELLTDDQLTRLRDAFRSAKAINDDRGYNWFAGVHGLPLPDSCRIAHGSPLFLPWHRAYLYKFERALQDAARDPGVTIPWWDWTSARSQEGRLPQAFATARGSDRRTNPLYSAKVDPLGLAQWNNQPGGPPFRYAPTTKRFLGEPGSPPLPTRERIEAVLKVPEFEAFSAALEGPHGDVHVWVGGERGHMGNVPFAAFDPIFWAHHSMVDRIWRLWQKQHKRASIPAHILDRPLPPFEFTVADMVDAPALGYDYASATTRVPA